MYIPDSMNRKENLELNYVCALLAFFYSLKKVQKDGTKSLKKKS